MANNNMKMLNSSHKGNANRNCSEIALHVHQGWLESGNVDDNVVKLEPLYIADGNIKCKSLWKTFCWLF